MMTNGGCSHMDIQDGTFKGDATCGERLQI
jgi:hypothetical protein